MSRGTNLGMSLPTEWAASCSNVLIYDAFDFVGSANTAEKHMGECHERSQSHASGRAADADCACFRHNHVGRKSAMTERELTVAYLHRDVAIRYLHAPLIQEAIERYAQCIEAGEHLENPK
jgi:hypothetical protein